MSVAESATAFEARQQRQTAIRWLMAMGLASVAGVTPLEAFERRWPRSIHIDVVRRAYSVKAPVPGGSSGTWMAPFTGPKVFLEAFATTVRQGSVLGRLPGAIEAPPNTRLPYPGGRIDAGWIGLGAAIPLSSAAFNDLTLPPFQLGSIAIATNELMKATGPQAEAVFGALLVNAGVTFSDRALLDPAQAAVADLSPASITNGAFTVPSTGPTLAALNADLGLVADNMLAAGIPLTSPVIIMSPASALRVGGLGVPAGQSLAAPVVLSPEAKDQVILLDASLLAYTDGGIDVNIAKDASVEMSDAPTSDADGPTAATGPMVSLWQVNATGFRMLQYLNWQLADPAACGVVSGFGATP